jgi:hypothetical protein
MNAKRGSFICEEFLHKVKYEKFITCWIFQLTVQSHMKETTLSQTKFLSVLRDSTHERK